MLGLDPATGSRGEKNVGEKQDKMRVLLTSLLKVTYDHSLARSTHFLLRVGLIMHFFYMLKDVL